MSLNINSIEIPAMGSIECNSIEVDTVVCDGVVVWERRSDFYIWENGTPHAEYSPTTYNTSDSGTASTMTFEYREGNYGLTVSNIHTSANKSVRCGFQLPIVNTKGCRYLKASTRYYLDSGKGARTWYFQVYGIKPDNSEVTLHDACYDPNEITIDISGCVQLRIVAHLVCANSSTDSCQGCTVGFYINSLYLYN